jgi:hypothetical protein
MRISILTACVFILSIALCVSCKDDEPEITNTIVGTWKGDRSEIKVTYGIVTLHEEVDEEFDATLEFKEDGTVTFTHDGTTTAGTYELNGDNLTTDVDFQFGDITVESLSFDVLELTETKLRLDFEQDEEVEVPDVGMVNTTIKGKFAFDRL